jgi:hypothetical protein
MVFLILTCHTFTILDKRGKFIHSWISTLSKFTLRLLAEISRVGLPRAGYLNVAVDSKDNRHAAAFTSLNQARVL